MRRRATAGAGHPLPVPGSEAPTLEVPLEGPIEEATRELDAVLAAARGLTPTVEGFMAFLAPAMERARDEGRFVSRITGDMMDPAAWAREVALDLTKLLDTLARTLQLLTRSISDAARLRSFLAGGADRRVEAIGGMPDARLLTMILTFAQQRGMLPPPPVTIDVTPRASDAAVVDAHPTA